MGEPFSVLVVDDEPILGKRVKPVLSRMGCDVEVFTDPAAAVRRLDERRFDLVITDMLMDPIDGMGVLSRVAEVSPDTLVIVITGYAMMEMAREAMDRGAFDFIHKPFAPDVIRESVRRAAASRGVELCGASPPAGAE